MVDLEIIELPDQLAICIRARTRLEQLPALIGESYHRILQYMGECGLVPNAAPFTAYFNMDPQDLEVEMGFPVSREVPGEGDILSVRIPATRAIVATHHGSYSTLTETYAAMNHHLSQQGLEAVGSAYEYYMTGPEVPENDHLTRIVLPLK